MSADVERVARACRVAKLVHMGHKPAMAAQLVAADTLTAAELRDTAAAMRETRLIDAEALRGPAIGFVDHLDVADWLTARAKETTDGQ
jgi:hypothetical protein